MCIDCYRAIIYTQTETQRSVHATPSHVVQAIDAACGSRSLQYRHIYDFHFQTSLLRFIRGDIRFGSAYLGGPRIQIDENQKEESTLFNSMFVETDCLVSSATHGQARGLAWATRRGGTLFVQRDTGVAFYTLWRVMKRF